MLKDYKLEQTVEPLLHWFSKNARALPWRENPTPYYVWVSEIMLQQTRVEAVKPYFDRFVSALPDVEALADCPEERLLKLWEGLGYYNRARNLQAAAKQIMEEYAGVIPEDYENLMKLKGIGSYTAGAIASIAYGKPRAAVDGNVLRVISRVTADDSDIMSQRVRRGMEDCLNELLQNYVFSKDTAVAGKGEKIPASQFNQALMELGATVCVPNGTPHCDGCPWGKLCLAKREGRIGEIPVRQKGKARRIEDMTVLVIRDGDRVAIQKRPNHGLLAGLYELPNQSGHLSEQAVLEYVKQAGCQPLRIRQLEDAKHIFSHVEWHMTGYVVWVESLDLESGHIEEGRELLFVEARDARERYAIPTAFARYAAYMNIPLGI